MTGDIKKPHTHIKTEREKKLNTDNNSKKIKPPCITANLQEQFQEMFYHEFAHTSTKSRHHNAHQDSLPGLQVG